MTEVDDDAPPLGCQVLGRWRIISVDLWDRDYLDLSGPATLTLERRGHGEIAFGAMQATLDLEYMREGVVFTWEGFDEGDEIRGKGDAILQEDGALEIEFEYHHSDIATLRAVRES